MNCALDPIVSLHACVEVALESLAPVPWANSQPNHSATALKHGWGKGQVMGRGVVQREAAATFSRYVKRGHSSSMGQNRIQNCTRGQNCSYMARNCHLGVHNEMEFCLWSLNGEDAHAISYRATF